MQRHYTDLDSSPLTTYHITSLKKMSARLYRQCLNKHLDLFFTALIVLHSFKTLGALFQIFAASFMNVCDWSLERPLITISGLLLFLANRWGCHLPAMCQVKIAVRFGRWQPQLYVNHVRTTSDSNCMWLRLPYANLLLNTTCNVFLASS